MDQHVSRIPLILEKIVDTLKVLIISYTFSLFFFDSLPPKQAKIDPIVFSEIFLLLRVLLLRVSGSRLLRSSFWPVILTELFHIFGSDDPQLDHVNYSAWR